ncbi:LysE family translocator [Marinimicrobium sp. ARAG 43.8]|uniref:LysE family translocator n=1 Tax=Marinimicrobium sp. ARAG 43.8 TaxID=3418719 RepID=UPI003CF89B4E
MVLTDLFWLTVTLASLAAIPSSSVALVVGCASVSGFSRGAAAALGVVLGDVVFVLAAVSGVAALAETWGPWLYALRYLAAAYLGWLALGLWRTARTPKPLATASVKAGLFACFASGLLLTLADVKAIVFYAALFPSLVAVEQLGVMDIVTVAGITVIAVGGVKLIYAALGARIAERFQSSGALARPFSDNGQPHWRFRLQKGLAMALGLAALYLIWPR